mgnify:CR=1 FL=1
MNNLRTRNLTNLPFSSYKSPVLLSPHFSPHQNTLFLSFLRGPLSCFLLSVSRIGTCRIHACLINSAFNLTDERDSAARENQRPRENSEKLRGEIRQLKTELEAEKQDHINTSQELKELKSHHEISKTRISKLADLVQQLTGESLF